MAENVSHLPQQNRRDRLRVVTTQNHNQSTLPSHQQTYMNMNSSSPQNLGDCNYHDPINHQGLSLSLSFHHARLNDRPLEFKTQNYDSILRNTVPLSPFTGYTSILKRSRFLKPTQQILEDFCGVHCEALIDHGLHSLCESEVVRETIACSDKMEHRWKNSRLMLMLDEVYGRHKLYCQQMQSVVASFETVPGLGNAAPYISFVVKAIAKHFSCLKNSILDQIQLTAKNLGDGIISGKDNTPTLTAEDCFQSHNSAQNFNFLQHPIWRSQRGLPDHAIAVLRGWLFEHFLHPYPTDSEKQFLAHQTGLSKTQVSNWFINARVRLWKPMVEEMHMLETWQAQIPSKPVSQYANMPSDKPPLANSLPAGKLIATQWRQEAHDVQTKRPKNNAACISEQNEEHNINAYHNLLSSNHKLGISGRSGAVSLALGLHQNNGITLLQPFSMTIAQHFNIERDGEMDPNAGFKARNQHLG
ncbi:Homeobox_KN domain-containing protein/POX domain-containing protein, partial [Cephalotus follicularis]